MTRGFLPIALSVLLSAGTMPLAFSASEPQLNFKIYSPDGASTAPAKADEAEAKAASEEKATSSTTPSAEAATTESVTADSAKAADAAKAESSNDLTSEKATAETPVKDDQLKKEEPAMSPTPAASTTADTDTTPTVTPTASETTTETPAASAFDTSAGASDKEGTAVETAKTDKKVLQGYIRTVPVGTKVPIIMDTAVDSDTSQEGDEFAARTSEDLSIDGSIVVPAGSVIKGRIAQLNAPKHLNRGGSVALKFDTVTTPDNRQIPLVANLVARAGVVHARRGMKDIAMDTGIVTAPLLAGILIGFVAGKSNTNTASGTTVNGTTVTATNNNNNSSKISKGGAAMIGAGVGLAVGVAILLAKKGKKVDVRPGDELKIELAEALRMPMM